MRLTIPIEFTNHSMENEEKQPSTLFARSQAAIEQRRGERAMIRYDALARKKPTHRMDQRNNANRDIPGNGHELLQLGSGAEQCLLQCEGDRVGK